MQLSTLLAAAGCVALASTSRADTLVIDFDSLPASSGFGGVPPGRNGGWGVLGGDRW